MENREKRKKEQAEIAEQRRKQERETKLNGEHMRLYLEARHPRCCCPDQAMSTFLRPSREEFNENEKENREKQ